MAGTGVGKFSSTASNNTSNLTVNFAENMAPSNVNNAARELMGHMRDMYEQLGDGYFEFGDGDGEYTVTRGDADTITITGTGDITSVYYVGRKIRITDGGGNVVEGVISASSHSSTTQTIDLTGISLASGAPTKVELGIDTAAFGGKVILDDDGDTYIEAPTDDTIDIYVAGAKDFTFTANTFTAHAGSNVDLDGDLDVDGTTNLDVVDIDGAVDMASTLVVGGVITVIDGSTSAPSITNAGDTNSGIYFPADDNIGLVVGGSRKLLANSTGVSIANGTFTTSDGGAVFNEGSADVDFRVESNGNDHMFFVDGGNDHVNIGTSTDHGGVLNIESPDNAITLLLASTDTDANAGPQLKLLRAVTGANNDICGKIEFGAKDSSGNAEAYALITQKILTAANGSEEGRLTFQVMEGGSQRDMLSLDASEVIINEDSRDIDFRVESNDGTHTLFVNANTNTVQIGRADSDGAANVKLQVEAVDSSSGISIHRGSADVAGPSLNLSSSRGASLGDDTVVQDGDTLGAIAAFGADGTDRASIAGSISFQVDGTPGSNDMPGRIVFKTTTDGGVTQTERMRIHNNGRISIGTTNADNVFKVEGESSAGADAFILTNTRSSGVARGLQLAYNSYAPNDGNPAFIFEDNAAVRFRINNTGDAKNANNSYGSTSDERIKSDIVDANSQWNDIKTIKVRNYKKKDDVRQYGDNAKSQIGVIAQELEEVSPKLVTESEPSKSDILSNSVFGTLYTSDDAETQDAVLYTSDDQEVIDGEKNVGDIKTPSTKQVGDIKSLTDEKVKSVSYSVLYMKAIKALQEAMTRIETLETKVAALEG